MVFEKLYCPTCGMIAVCTVDVIHALASLGEPDEIWSDIDYAGESTVDWDSQTTLTNDKGEKLLRCQDGHEWYSRELERLSCDQCEMLSINGVPCHETGCPNMGSRWKNGTWVKYLKCHTCGDDVRVGESCDCQDVPDLDDFPIEDWQYHVQNGDTKLGFDEWVEHSREAEGK